MTEYRKQPDTVQPGESRSATGEHPCGKCGGTGIIEPGGIRALMKDHSCTWCGGTGICPGEMKTVATREAGPRGATWTEIARMKCARCGAEVEL